MGNRDHAGGRGRGPHLLAMGAVALAVACGPADEPRPDPAQVVAAELAGNELGITAADLRSMPNPRGEGDLVYVERTLYAEGVRYLIWLVLDGTAYTINGQTHHVTPGLPYPRSAGERWSRTGLDPDRATGALDIVFPER